MEYTTQSGIYLLRNQINNKIYIGKSTNIADRIRRHKQSEHQNRGVNCAIIKAIKKYKWENFQVEIIETFEVIPPNLLDIEEKYIILFNSCNRNIGYNLLKRSTDWTGYKHTEETKQKLSILRKGKRTGKENSMYGRKHTEESKRKMQQPRTRKTKKVEQLDPNTLSLIKIWNSVEEAAIAITSKNISKEQIYRVCNKYINEKGNLRKTALGFRWRYHIPPTFIA